jgi:hypothetical protein
MQEMSDLMTSQPLPYFHRRCTHKPKGDHWSPSFSCKHGKAQILCHIFGKLPVDHPNFSFPDKNLNYISTHAHSQQSVNHIYHNIPRHVKIFQCFPKSNKHRIFTVSFHHSYSLSASHHLNQTYRESQSHLKSQSHTYPLSHSITQPIYKNLNYFYWTITLHQVARHSKCLDDLHSNPSARHTYPRCIRHTAQSIRHLQRVSSSHTFHLGPFVPGLIGYSVLHSVVVTLWSVSTWCISPSHTLPAFPHSQTSVRFRTAHSQPSLSVCLSA